MNTTTDILSHVNALVAAETALYRLLAQHVLAMAYDPYLDGHPEWAEIVKDARAALQSVSGNTDITDLRTENAQLKSALDSVTNEALRRIGEFKAENARLREALTEMYSYAQLYHSQCVIKGAINAERPLWQDVVEARMAKARAALSRARGEK